MATRQPSRAFTSSYENRRSNQLINHVLITETFEPTTPPVTTSGLQALWDTGAQATCITPKVAADLNLTPATYKRVRGAYGGETVRPAYRVCLYLPDLVVVDNLLVTQAEIGGADVLIGMDVIGHGDFAVTNFNDVTKFSFRMPSTGEIDFAKEIRETVTNAHGIKVGRNDPCPCGSKKKYKKCCGK